MPIHHPDYTHPALEAFAPLARAFCQHLDDLSALVPEAFLGSAHVLLPQLYAAALALPPTGVLFDPGTDEEDDDAPLAHEPDLDRGSHEEWTARFHVLQGLIGDHDFYREIFDPYAPHSDTEVMGSLADDLLDIYRDLRSGLRKWDRGETGEALWEWRFNFEIHWGEHVTGALRALHVRASTHNLPWPASGTGAA
jgi:hypothetical protein